VTLPTGRFKGLPLTQVQTKYLQWYLATVKTSSGVEAGIVAELSRRGAPVPEPPPARRQPPTCPTCGPEGGYTCAWQNDILGRPHVKATCGRCGRFLKFVPCVEPFTSMAEADAAGAAGSTI
jgi:hypothetical protein